MDESQNFHYAGFWRRFLAHIIDQLVLGMIQGVILIPFWIFFGLSLFSSEMMNENNFVSAALRCQDYGDDLSIIAASVIIIVVIVIVIISTLFQWLYYALMESSKRQATLGKMALGIKVTDTDGNRISFGRASGRYFAKFISGFVFMIGYIMAGFTAKKQALHDIIASCLVIVE